MEKMTSKKISGCHTDLWKLLNWLIVLKKFRNIRNNGFLISFEKQGLSEKSRCDIIKYTFLQIITIEHFALEISGKTEYCNNCKIITRKLFEISFM